MTDGPIAYVASHRAEADAVRLAAKSGAHAAFVVFDRAVAGRADIVRRALKKSGIRILGQTSIAGGERAKHMRVVAKIYRDLAASGVDRKTLLVVIGGGTVTDIAGFAAATYLRGIAWLPIASTVLGMVDAAIGGKTGLDLQEGKNLVGAFWPPVGTVADLRALESLPLRERRTGMAEIVKSAIVGDPGLLRICETFPVDLPDADWPAVIRRAASVKVRVVQRDLRDTGVRATLNLGHTVGHALEVTSGYRLAHGAAVAVGLRAAGLLALQRGMWSRRAHARVLGALGHAGLSVQIAIPSISAVVAAMRRDKKRVGGTHRFVLPERLGNVIADIVVTEPEIRRVLAICSRAPQAAELA
jgi:3-dehydroquinate synthetase